MLPFRSLLLFCFTAISALSAQTMQTGFGFVSSIRGTVGAFNKNDEPHKLALHENHPLDGIKIQTDHKGTLTLVLSNGVAIALYENSQIEFKTFKQIPFAPNTSSSEYEPTISELHIHLIQGTMGLSCDHISPLSNLKIQMQDGHLRVHSTTSVLTVNPLGMKVSAFKGTLTFYYPNGTEENSSRIHKAYASVNKVLPEGSLPKVAPLVPKPLPNDDWQMRLNSPDLAPSTAAYRENPTRNRSNVSLKATLNKHPCDLIASINPIIHESHLL